MMEEFPTDFRLRNTINNSTALGFEKYLQQYSIELHIINPIN